MKGGRGFTLIEMVLVLAILAIAVFFVLPSVGRGTEGLRLRTEGGRIAALLRDARRQAVTRREPVRVSLDRVTGAVSLTLGEAATPARRIEVPEGFRLDAGEGGEAVTFSPRGTPAKRTGRSRTGVGAASPSRSRP